MKNGTFKIIRCFVAADFNLEFSAKTYLHSLPFLIPLQNRVSDIFKNEFAVFGFASLLIKSLKFCIISIPMFTLKFAFKNIISRKSSIVIVLFVAFSIAILVMANAIFDGTRSGVEKTFSDNFTGDIVIRPHAQFPMSLFGDETPITGEFSELPQLIPYLDIFEYVQKSPFIDKAVPQITGQAVLRVNDKNIPGYFFGVEGEPYIKLMEGIRILEGEPFSQDDDALMLSASVVERINEECGVRVNVGDQIQMASFTGTSYALRAARLAAIYEYSVHNDLQDKIILVSPAILRVLIGLGSTEIDPALFTNENSGLLETVESGSIDDLFNDAGDFDSDDFLFDDVMISEEILENAGDVNSFAESLSDENEETIWNYIVCSVPNGVSPKQAIRRLNRAFEKFEWTVQAVDWRAAAGMMAQYIYWIRLIFNIGLLVIIGTGYIIVNNTLVIAALDRTKETGTLRAIGASRRFVAAEYLLETLMLTLTAGILGCVIGVIGNSFLSGGTVTFTNSYLIQLFGGESLNTVISASNIFWGIALSFALAFVTWIYTVQIALGASPVVAMEAVR